jgi:DNA-binding SARP family transcriptional activator
LTVLVTDDRRLAPNELRRKLDECAYMEVFESMPQAVVLVDHAGRVAAHNPAARELFGALVDRPALRCCDLARCGGGGYRCIATAVADRCLPLHGSGFVLDGRHIEITAVPLRSGAGAVLHFQAAAAEAAARAPGPSLRITTLGPLRLARAGVALGGEWLGHRPGQLLKYLICARGRRVPVEELVEALWAGSGRAGLISLRQAVHGLRDRLEPDRPKHAPSRFVLARPNAYELDTANIVVDADEFERQAVSGLLALERSGGREAEAQLAAAARMYWSEFLADDPYAEWALAERDRLRELAARVLRALADTHLASGRLRAAGGALQRVADMEPFDLDAQRDLISLMLRMRRHAEAARRYDLVRRTFKRTFGRDPDFTLADLVEPDALAA